jgi:MFS family permease
VLFLHEAHGVDPRHAGIVLAGVQLSGAALRLAAGRWSDRAGSRIGPLILLAGGLTCALLATGVTAGTSLGLVVVPLAVAGALALSWNALSYTAAAELGGAHAGAALGIQQTALSLGAVSAPILFALAVDSAGWSVSYLLAAGAAGGGALVLRRLNHA